MENNSVYIDHLVELWKDWGTLFLLYDFSILSLEEWRDPLINIVKEAYDEEIKVIVKTVKGGKETSEYLNKNRIPFTSINTTSVKAGTYMYIKKSPNLSSSIEIVKEVLSRIRTEKKQSSNLNIV